MRGEPGAEEAVRLLTQYSTAQGRGVGAQQAARAPDTTFATFTRAFRPPAYARSLVHEVVEDTDTAFGLRVTRCVWAEVFKEAGVDGAFGHAAVCNMDYAVPTTFNPRLRMERDRTLMQGHDHCNHRYVQDAE